MRDKLTKLFEEVGRDYENYGIASLELNQGHDVHAFYWLIPYECKPIKVVHVQGYPGMSTDDKARVFARLMDLNKMLEIRCKEGVSIGNEHDAVIKPFPDFFGGIYIPYDAKVLEEMLAENVPELRGRK